VPPEKRSFSKDAELASRAGRNGGISKSRHMRDAVEAASGVAMGSQSHEPTDAARPLRTDMSKAE
jgi:hypothetical protein